MNFFQIVVLAVVQGLTEFIPVSSSGHLVLVRELFGWSDEGGVFLDVLLHAGSLLAVFIYFFKDWWQLALSILCPRGEMAGVGRRFLLMLVVATLPAALIGPFADHFMNVVRHGWVVGLVMLLTAVWFVFCERRKREERSEMSFPTALLMGMAQLLALLPGASRSGLTTSTGLLAGQPRHMAAKFSFFMVAPTIVGALLLKCHNMEDISLFDPWALAGGCLVCFLVSLGAIHFCMRIFRKHSLIGFAGYLAVLGCTVLVLSFIK